MRTLVLVLVLIGVPLVGAVNYMRNEPLDEELKQRPYAGIKDADLDALLGAYGKQVQRTRSAVTAEPGSSESSDPSQFGDYDEKVEAFEKFQHTNEQWKHTRGQLFGEQTTLQALQHEKSIRDRGLNQPMNRIWRRVSTF